MPCASGLVSVEQASDEQFQTWIVANNLEELVDDGGIAAWSFDDRCRVINFALRLGRPLQFASETIPQEEQNNSPSRIVSELFEQDSVALEATGDDSTPNGAA